jgi:type IV pilus assembly protein PilE
MIQLSKRGNIMSGLLTIQYRRSNFAARSNQKQLNLNHKGFTLVELMIVVAIISILASIAIPAYSDYVTRGKIAQAISELADARIKMEQFYQDNRTYSPGINAASLGIASGSKSYFTYALSSVGLTSYTITATGVGTISTYSYTINQSNTKTSATPWGNSSTCWVKSKGGVC